jgi:Domain of unknown function (DUF222)/HNH endonuclease
MCSPGQPPAPANAAEAIAMAEAGLGFLAEADATALTGAEQAEVLRGLERSRSRHATAQARTLAAFSASGGHEADGHPTARSWLRWQTHLTVGAAAGAVAWMRRLAAHPRIAGEMACGSISESWARELCRWSDLLPEDARDDADQILLGVAAAGAELDDLARLAEEIRRRTAVPDADDDDGGFGDRYLRLGKTFRGAGRLDGDLTPECTAALEAVLDALGRKNGPEDTRTARQRRHDALEEAMRRLIASGCVPQRAGQPTQIQVHMTLDQLRGLPGAPEQEAAFPGPAAPPGSDCDAQIVPIVTGHVDPGVVDQLAAALLRGTPAGPVTVPAAFAGPAAASATTGPVITPADAWLDAPGWLAQAAARAVGNRLSSQSRAGVPDTADATRRRLAYATVRQLIVKAAAEVLSGPQGLAAFLRTGLLGGPAASVSLPLDAGATVEIVPAYLRRLLVKRDKHCRFPGCHQPAQACHPHHIIPRSQGGPTSLTNLLLLCSFHHLIAVHRWGWGIALMPDGTVSATSPDGSQILHGHGPPTQAA